jgi:hypothetical protein
VYKPEKFAKKLEANNHFLRAVLDGEKLFVVGGEHDLGRTVTALANVQNRPLYLNAAFE